jgi:dihydropteroate synthase
MLDKYLFALGRGVRGAKKALEAASRAPDPAESARDITPAHVEGEAPPRAATSSRAFPVLPYGVRPLVMGVVNVTPDSFSDGGRFLDPAQAIAHGLRLVGEGADILDVGGESTRPGHAPVAVDDEIARVVPVVRGLAAATDVPISIDTMKAAVARAALDAGAVIVNDVWGFQRDPEMAPLVAERGVLAVVMHNREHDDPSIDVVAEVVDFLERSIAVAEAAGASRAQLIVDPGFGFGKTHAQSLALVRELGRLKRFGLPILLGASRKRAIGRVTGRDEPAERVVGSIAAHLLGAVAGASIIRAHDVAAHVEAMKMFAAIVDPAAGEP